MSLSTITCSKRYDDLPFAHRQPNHKGHCSLIHGHNWCFEFEFRADELDACGFVIDFGELKWLRQWIEDRFDHTLVLNSNDPWLEFMRSHLEEATDGDLSTVECATLAKIITVPDCSSEGLCQWLLANVHDLIKDQTDGRVGVHRVTVIEDSKNFATITRS